MGQWPSPCRDRIKVKTPRQTTCYRTCIALNCDVEHRLAGIEILDVARRLRNTQTRNQVIFEYSALLESPF